MIAFVSSKVLTACGLVGWRIGGRSRDTPARTLAPLYKPIFACTTASPRTSITSSQEETSEPEPFLHRSWSGEAIHGAGEEEAGAEAAEGPEGAEGQALHHPPLRRHASVLERLIWAHSRA